MPVVMRNYAGPLVCLIAVVTAPACGDDDIACGEPASFALATLEPEWQWTGGELASLPIVADVDGDGIPEIVINITRAGTDDDNIGELALLDSTTGKQKWRLRHEPGKQRFGSHGRATLAVTDVDGDKLPDIIYAGRPDGDALDARSPIHAVNGNGQLLWTSHHANGQPAAVLASYGAIAVANLDADPNAEVVLGATILDHDGLLVWDQNNNGGLFGTPTDNRPQPRALYPGSLATVVDLDADGTPEILSGRDAWKLAWTPGSPPSVSLSRLWQNTDGMGNDGWPAVADLDANGTPEVVLVAWPDIKVLDGRTGALWCGVDPSGVACEKNDALRTRPIAIQGGNLGGPATLADFDGDGRLEAAIAGGTALAVYDFNRADETIVVPESTPKPAPGAMYVRWFARTQDNSSASAGSSAFDFDFDGIPELLHQDECHFRVFDGLTGTILGEIQNSSFTGHEYPVVADIDGDAKTEILVIANHSEPIINNNCAQASPDFKTRQGLFVYGPGDQRWAQARAMWPQYNHHITDMNPGGTVPTRETPHWTYALSNGFRHALTAPGASGCE